MKKLLSMSCLLLSSLFGFAQENTCGVIENGDFEQSVCSAFVKPFANGCAGQNWDCYHGFPSVLTLSSNFLTPSPLPSHGNAIALLPFNSKDVTGSIVYKETGSSALTQGFYDISVDVASLVNPLGEGKTAAFFVVAVEPADLTPTCPSNSEGFPLLPDLDLQEIIPLTIIQPGAPWTTLPFSDVIDIPNNATNEVAFVLVVLPGGGEGPGSLGVDNFCAIKEPCAELACEVYSSLTTCPETNSTGYVYANCPEAVVMGWDIPNGSTATQVGSGTSLGIVNASPGTYYLRLIDADNCESVIPYVITENCCEVDPNACNIPTRLSCENLETYVRVSWDAVPSASSYQVKTIINDSDCGCSGPESETIGNTSINTFYIPIYQLNNPCFSWQVRTICSESEGSEYSEPQCFSPSSRCDFREEGAFGDQEKAAIGQNNKPIVYPNPTDDEVNYQYHLEAAGDLTIDIFDTQGKLIEQFQFENLEQGLFKTRLNIAKTQASGMYFINTRTNDKQFQERLLILE